MQNQTVNYLCVGCPQWSVGQVVSVAPVSPTLVCEHGVTHYDGWSNYVPTRPLRHSWTICSVLESGFSYTWNCTKTLLSFLSALSVFLSLSATLNVGIKIRSKSEPDVVWGVEV